MSEKRGGWFQMRRDQKFIGNIDRCELLDLGFKGSPHFQRRVHGAIISTQVRLDRALANAEWRYVPPRGLGHSIFKLHERCMKSLKLWRPIHGEINFDSSLMDALSNMARQAQILNRDVFGNIFGSIRRILARVQGIQK
ncbi:uncharacterized protein LOC133691773 [Populus nigra]|uniref:uncharacterized protein LOC133691773 n=1 Tax=Populus nigra TaxID=3691 RepID=UPI002B273707|nr:uncharacterized protein LOC133691773 [Populus nigra]